VWGVFGKVIGRWRLLKEIEPGRRFQARYHKHRRRREQGKTSKWVILLNLISGPALIVAGFLFLPTPGPSYIIIVLGMWMLAGEYLPLARFFDRVEVRLRKVGRWTKGRWNSTPAVVKVLVVLTCAAALGYGAYYLLFGG
jgi:Putative transmembrane protein (PGPGW)